MQRILVPLDLAPLGEVKVPVTEEYARAFDADVILLHVLPRGAMDAEAVSQQEATARAYLDSVVAHLTSASVRASAQIRTGPTAQTIVEEAHTQEAGLIILGSHVRRGLVTVLSANIADHVVRWSPCPVLLVQPALEAGGSPPLRSFADDAERSGAVTRRSLGLRTVEVARIVGSVGRARDFGPDFRPLQRSRSYTDRYARIRAALDRGEPLPPIELYRLGFGYYVLDGHHRVAAAKESGQLEIDAHVTEFLPLADTQAARTFAERRAFERSTGLTGIGARRPESYPDLAALIAAFRAEHGIADFRAAAQQWYGQVFRPLWQRVRQLRLTRYFPGERSADVIARLGTWRASRPDGLAMEWSEALTRFQEELAARGEAVPRPGS